jgi:tripartite-type tricarboxylate transporter receptor subunit TctC
LTRTPSRIGRRAVAVLLAACAAGFSLQAPAQDFPNRPIRMLLPYGAGGIGDLTARVIAQKMGDSMGQAIVIDNRPGAGGIQAFQAALQAPADGYTLVMGGNGTAISQSMFKKLPYDILKDFTQVSAMARFSLVLLVKPDSGIRSVADLVAQAKAHPGKLNFGTTSVGSTQHLSAELFKSVAGVDAQVVPFKVSAELYTALRSGNIDVAFEFVPPVLSSIKSGAVRALAIAADKRHPSLSDVPTTAEGGLKGYEVTSWNAVSVKTGAPKAIVDRLNKEFVAAINSPEVSQKLREMNSEPYALTPEQTRQLMTSEIARWKAVIVRADIERN